MSRRPEAKFVQRNSSLLTNIQQKLKVRVRTVKIEHHFSMRVREREMAKLQLITAFTLSPLLHAHRRIPHLLSSINLLMGIQNKKT